MLLTDFGIAKSPPRCSALTGTGNLLATLAYASPEQIEARQLDHRVDIYALGCVLYELLTGSRALPRRDAVRHRPRATSSRSPKVTEKVPWLPPGLDDVTWRAMAKNAADRYPTCRASRRRRSRDGRLPGAATPAVPRLPVPVGQRVRSRGAGRTDGTEGMTEQASAHLVELVRRTRFFDLPEQLAAATPPDHRRVTLEISCTNGRAHRVVADLDAARRPPDLDDSRDR